MLVFNQLANFSPIGGLLESSLDPVDPQPGNRYNGLVIRDLWEATLLAFQATSYVEQLYRIFRYHHSHPVTNQTRHSSLEHLQRCVQCRFELILITVCSVASRRRLWDSFNLESTFLHLVTGTLFSSASCYTYLLECRRTAKATLYLSYTSSSEPAQSSLFNFLRWSSLKRLCDARKIIANKDGFLITHIGNGSFARIARVWHRPTGRVRVMKRMTLDSKGLAESLIRIEIDALESLKGCCWLPSILGHFNDGEDWVIIMPYYRRGDLGNFIEHRGFLGRDVAKFYCSELIIAIEHLHRKGFVHRDIKPDNIFLTDEGHLVLADLGLAEKIAPLASGKMRMSTVINWGKMRDGVHQEFPYLWVSDANPFGTRGVSGTHWYSAPEIFRAERYSFGVDYWSVGVIYYELVTGHMPFNNFRPYPEDKRLMLDFRRKPNQLKCLTDREKQDISKMLDDNPLNRYQSATEIKKCKLFSGIDWERMARQEVVPPSLPPPLREDDVPISFVPE